MKQPLSLLAILIASALQIMSCSKSDNVLSSGSTGETRLKGSLSGTVGLLSTQGAILPDARGITVQIEGTSLTATTDSTGYWTVHDLPAGTYIIDYSKPGFGEVKQFGIEFVGGGDAYLNPNGNEYAQPLQQIPSGAAITNLLARAVDTMVVDIKGGDTTDPTHTPVLTRLKRVALSFTVPDTLSAIIYLGHGSDVSATNGIVATDMSAQTLYSQGFPSGSTLYIIAYPGPRYHRADYYDPRIRQEVWTSYSTAGAAVTSVVVP